MRLVFPVNPSILRRGVLPFAALVLIAFQLGPRSREEGVAAERRPAARSTPARERVPAVKPFDRDSFLRVFQSAREEPRFKSLDNIVRGHRQNPDVPAALWSAIERDVYLRRILPSTLTAIALHGSLDAPDVVAQLISLLTAADPRVALIATAGLERRHPPEALQPLLKLPSHPAYKSTYALRHATVGAVGQYPEKPAVDFLVDTVEHARGQLKYEAARHLALRTGQPFGGIGRDWKQWWASQRNTFEFKPVAGVAPSSPEAVPRAIQWEAEVPTFYGVPIYAERVVFVIDRSASMLSSVDDVTRLSEAQRELEGAIRKLPDSAWFNIIAYESNYITYKNGLVSATALEKSEAVQFVYRLDAFGKTACYDALEGALVLDQELEAILFLSDGEPTAGRIVDPRQIVDELTRENQLRRVSINTIGIDARDIWEQFLQQLAGANFGIYHSIR